MNRRDRPGIVETLEGRLARGIKFHTVLSRVDGASTLEEPTMDSAPLEVLSIPSRLQILFSHSGETFRISSFLKGFFKRLYGMGLSFKYSDEQSVKGTGGFHLKRFKRC